MMHTFMMIAALIGLATMLPVGLYVWHTAEELADKLSSRAPSLPLLMKVCAYGMAPIISFFPFLVLVLGYVAIVITAGVLIFTGEMNTVSRVLLAFFDAVALIGGIRIAGEYENRRDDRKVRIRPNNAKVRLW